MASVCFYFQVHQPFRIKRFRFFDIAQNHTYFGEDADTDLNNKKILHKVAQKCYLPMNDLLYRLIKKYPKFKVSFSISGVALEQFEKYAPEVIESFQKLVKTGNVELISETYYHSLSFLYSRSEFRSQIELHKGTLNRLFKYEPTVFRNTELIFNNDLAHEIEKMGYKGIIAEGADFILGWKSPNFIYRPKGCKRLKLLVKNYKLSDDIAFRFSNRGWKEWPLTTEKFAHWVNQVNGNGELINLFMDYETFGEHQWADTGIFDFMEALPNEILKHPDNSFVTPSQAIEKYRSHGELDYPHFVSWADTERDLSAWLSNAIQHDAIQQVYALEEKIQHVRDAQIIDDWRKLQTSDHFYYMCTKWFADGDVHKYFNPYESPYEAFITYMNAVHDLKIRIEKHVENRTHKQYA